MTFETSSFQNPRFTAVIVLLAIICVYLFTASRTTLWDRDEPRFARAAVEMLSTGNYLVPVFNGKLWLDKPILTYWCQAFAMKLFGQTEFACRFFSAIGTSISCFFIYLIASRLCNFQLGIWAMVILATSIMTFVIGTFATSDGVTIPFTVGSMLIFAHALTSSLRWYHMVLLGIALGFGMLAKGPIGLLPVPAIAVTVLMLRKNLNFWRYLLYGILAIIIGFGIFLIWAFPANKMTEGNFFKEFIGRHVIERALKPMEHHGGNFWVYLPYYIPVIIGGFFPWILFLPGVFSAIISKRIADTKTRALLIGWIVPVFIIMSLASTKLPHYILFIWPALALGVAAVLYADKNNRLNDADKMWLRRGVWFFLPVALGMSSVLIVSPYLLKISTMKISGMVTAVVLVVMSVQIYRLQQANKFAAAAKTMIIGTAIFEILFVSTVIPYLEQIKITPYISEQVRKNSDVNVPAAMYKFAEPSLNFYIGRNIEHIREEKRLLEWIRQDSSGILIIPVDIITDIECRYGPLHLEKIASRKGYNYSKGKEVEIAVVMRSKR